MIEFDVLTIEAPLVDSCDDGTIYVGYTGLDIGGGYGNGWMFFRERLSSGINYAKGYGKSD